MRCLVKTHLSFILCPRCDRKLMFYIRKSLFDSMQQNGDFTFLLQTPKIALWSRCII